MRTAQMALALAAAGFLAACGDDGSGPATQPALEISAMSPAPNAGAVETGATVSVTFNQAIDPATLTAATFVVKAGGVALPAALSYDAATQTARAAAPLLPDSPYSVEVTTGVRTPADSALAAAAVWTFTTRAWQVVTLDTTGTVGHYSSLAVDPGGRRHVTYHDATNGDLKYATCGAGCDAADSWGAVTVDASGSVEGHTSLVVDASGRLHISYFGGANFDLRYATCAAGCRAVTVDTPGVVGLFTSLAMDAGGRLHASYHASTTGDLKYATCGAGCDAAAGWQAVTVGAVGSFGGFTSLAVDASGRLHVTYHDGTKATLGYATCAAGCAATAGWQAVTVDTGGTVGLYTSLAVDAGARLHVTYNDFENGDLKYASCAAGCNAAAGWQAVTVDTAGVVGQFTSLAVDASGRLHVSYHAASSGDLKYATCAAGCATAANWRAVTLDATGNVGQSSSLAVGAGGRLHITYVNNSTGDLKYIE